MIKNAMKLSPPSFHQKYESLIQNGSLQTEVLLETSFYEQSSTPSLWGLLVNAGYLIISQIISAPNYVYQLQIPNQEVQREFISLTELYLKIDNGI